MRKVISPILFVFIIAISGVAQKPQDRGWPRGYNLPNEAQIVLFQPQIASWFIRPERCAEAYPGHDQGRERYAGFTRTTAGEVFDAQDYRGQFPNVAERADAGNRQRD